MINENEKQLVSIGLMTFNRASTLVRAVDSLLAQTYTNFEIIISDNASEDDTEKICREYVQKDSRVRYYRQERNIGMTSNFNFIVGKVNGDYFVHGSDDDWWHPDFILKLKKALDEHPEYGVAMCSLRQIYEDGSLVNEIIYDGLSDISKLNYSQVFDAIIKKNPPIHFFICGLFRRDIFDKIETRLPTPRSIAPDKVVMYEAALITHFYSIPDILWVRTFYSKPDAERHTGDYQKIITDERAYLKHIKLSLSRLFSSPYIKLSIKFTLLPRKILVLIWEERKHIVEELWPSGFRSFKKLLKRV